MWNAQDKGHALDAVSRFTATYGAKLPKAVAKITDDLDELLALYDYPAEHRVHLRTTNPIESTFATVRHRSKIAKGPGSRAAGLAMAFKLIQAAQARWRAVNAPHPVALVRAGAAFQDGKLIERPDDNPNRKPPRRSSSTARGVLGPPGIGKTELPHSGVARFADAHHANRLQAELVRLARYPLPVIDAVACPFEAKAAKRPSTNGRVHVRSRHGNCVIGPTA